MGRRVHGTAPGKSAYYRNPRRGPRSRAKDIMTFVSDIDAVLNVSPPARTADAEAAQVSVFVPIMRGCNNFCSYCVVPYVRGEEQSIPAAQLENTVRN